MSEIPLIFEGWAHLLATLRHESVNKGSDSDHCLGRARGSPCVPTVPMACSCARCIFPPPPHTLHHPPSTLHPTPNTLHSSPNTQSPTPCTLHPAPYTLNPTMQAPGPRKGFAIWLDGC